MEAFFSTLSKTQGVYTETGRAEAMKYFVLYERTSNGYSAHVPDLPGCIAAAATLEETRQLMKEAFHLEGMRLHGEHIPESLTIGEEECARKPHPTELQL
jgi:predicted RNase H-like HicB family nuclease